jgi:vacuolar protein sorting-associated protein 13A/C
LEIQQRLSATFTGSSVKVQDNQEVESSLQQEEQASSVTFNDSPPDDIQEDSKPVTGTQLDLCFDMGLVCLELFNRSEQGIQASDQHSLGRLSFDSTSMKLKKMTNGPMVLDMQMRSINLYDTRYDSKSCFKDIFPAGKQLDGPQLQVHIKSGAKTEEGNDITSVDVTLDRPQVVVSLDYMMLLKDFFAAPFETAPPPTEAQAYAASLYGDSPSDSTKLVRPSSARSNSNVNRSSAGQASSKSKSTLHYKIAVLDLELVCLAHPDIHSSEAMVLSFDKLSMIQQNKFDLQLNGIGLLLCRMDNRNESATQLVDRFDVGVDIQTLTSSTFKNTNINAVIQPIKLRFSYNNVMLILDIVKKVTALVEKSTNKEDDDGFAANSVNDVAADDDAHDSDLDHMLNMTSLLSEPGDGMTRQLYTTYRHSGDQQKQRRDKGPVDDTHGVKSRESVSEMVSLHEHRTLTTFLSNVSLVERPL